MDSRYDVFAGTRENPRWLGSADGLNCAISQMEESARSDPGHYFVFDSKCQAVVASIHTNGDKDSDLDREVLGRP